LYDGRLKMTVKKTKCKSAKNTEPWYALNDEDILTVAEELEIKLSEEQIKKIKDIVPDYIDWFGAIETAINDICSQTRISASR
jgi:hypothetical protein